MMTRAEMLQLGGQQLDVAGALARGWPWLRPRHGGFTALLPPGYILRYNWEGGLIYKLSSAEAARYSDWAAQIPPYHADLEKAWELDGQNWTWHFSDSYADGYRSLSFMIIENRTWRRLAHFTMPWVANGFAIGRCRAYLLAKLAAEEGQ
jgi:hypothetical protein